MKTTKGSRNQAQEIIENLSVIQHAKRHLFDPLMNNSFRAYLRANSSVTLDPPQTDRTFVLRNQCSEEDADVRRLFPHDNIQFFNVLYLKKTRLCTLAYGRGKTTDDSNILFRLNGRNRFGRIRTIFRIDDDLPVLFVTNFVNGSPLICSLDNNHKMEYPDIQIAAAVNWSNVCIDIDDFVEKTTFYETSGQESCFCRFPTLIHSS